MFELSQAQLSRAIDVLRSGPIKADVFATRMWPDREYKNGDAGRAGHLILRKLGSLGFVERVGDLWMTRSFSQSIPVVTQVTTQVPLGVRPGEALREPLLERPQEPLREPLQEAHQEGHEDRQRLGHLVGLADEPVPTVTHDRALGDIRIRGIPLDACLVEACAFAVLRGRSLNIYPPSGPMIVNLSPGEGARALYLKWKQSGQPPEPPYRGGTGWFSMDDGISSAPGCWQPLGASRDWRMTEEPFLDRIARQRAAAGLGPPVQQNGGRR
jgi:hypothetical protein